MEIDGYKIVPGAQYTRPVNVNGAFDVSSNINYSFPVRAIGGSIHLINRLSFERDATQINNVSNFIDDYVATATVKLTMNIKERFDLNLSSASTLNYVRYSLQPDRNGDFFTQRFSIEPTYTSKSGWIFSSDFDYIMNRGQSEGYNQSIPLWNAGIAKLFLKQQQAELRLKVFEALNKNQLISRNVEQNYVEDLKTEVLNRYFLLSFTYHIKSYSVNGKQK